MKSLFFIALLFLASCSVDSKISESTLSDFAKSRIVSHDDVLADGSSQMMVRVQLQHADGRYASGFTPNISIISGVGVVNDGCTVSDENGYSICKLRSTIFGSKSISLNLADYVPSSLAVESVNFLRPGSNGGTITAVGGSNLLKQTVGGYTIHSRIGFESGKLSQTAGDYRIETSLVPSITDSN